jgi:hypothetical protein
MIYEDGEPRWNNNDRGTKELGEKPIPSATFFTKNLTWTDPDANVGPPWLVAGL